MYLVSMHILCAKIRTARTRTLSFSFPFVLVVSVPVVVSVAKTVVAPAVIVVVGIVVTPTFRSVVGPTVVVIVLVVPLCVLFAFTVTFAFTFTTTVTATFASTFATAPLKLGATGVEHGGAASLAVQRLHPGLTDDVAVCEHFCKMQTWVTFTMDGYAIQHIIKTFTNNFLNCSHRQLVFCHYSSVPDCLIPVTDELHQVASDLCPRSGSSMSAARSSRRSKGDLTMLVALSFRKAQTKACPSSLLTF